MCGSPLSWTGTSQSASTRHREWTGHVTTTPTGVARRAGRPGLGPAGMTGPAGRAGPAVDQAFHWLQGRFQPLRPLYHWTVLSLELITWTTSPMIELL